MIFAGPLPPAPTGIATYDRAVLDGLDRIGFTDRLRMDIVWPVGTQDAGRFPGLPPRRVPARQQRGVPPRDLPRRVPHERARRAARPRARRLRARPEGGGRAARLHGGARGRRGCGTSSPTPTCVRNEPLREPWCAHVARRARGVIVHSDFGRRYLEGLRVPHAGVRGAAPRDRGARRVRGGRAAGRASCGRASGSPAFLVVAPGDMNEAKQLDALVQRRGRARRRRARRDRRPAHRGLRRRAASIAAAGVGDRVQRARRRLRRRLPRLARRGRRRRRPAVPASRRGERVAQPRDAGRPGRRS